MSSPPSASATVAEHVSPRSPELVALVFVLLLAAGVRLWQIRESLWLDELHTAWVVADGPGAVAARARIGNHSPPYFFAVWAVRGALGASELTLRLPSVVAGLALIGLLYVAVRRWTGSASAALLAALLAALDRYCLFYAQEARPYACVQLVGLSQLLLFARLLEAPRGWRRWAFVALSGLLFYLHYTAALLVAAEVVAYGVLAVRPAWRPAYRWRAFLLDLGLWLLGCLPAFPHLTAIAEHRANWSLFVHRQPLSGIWTLFPLDLYLVLPLAISGVCWALRRWRRREVGRPTGKERPVDSRPRGERDGPEGPSYGPEPGAGQGPDARWFVLAGCWLFVPLTLAWLSTAVDFARLFFLRYLIVAAAAPLVCAALVWAACPRGFCRWLGGVALLAAVTYHGGLFGQWARDGRLLGDRNQDWRSAVALIEGRPQSRGWPVFVRSGLIEADRLRTSADPLLREYCLLPVRGIYRLTPPDRELIPLPTTRAGELSGAQRRRAVAAGGAWFLILGSPSDVQQIAVRLRRGWTAVGAQAEVQEAQAFGDVAVLRLSVQPLTCSLRESIAVHETTAGRAGIPRASSVVPQIDSDPALSYGSRVQAKVD